MKTVTHGRISAQGGRAWALFLFALAGIEDKGNDEMLERFSAKIPGGSKDLKERCGSLVTVIREFLS
jgi:hypothetical protein